MDCRAEREERRFRVGGQTGRTDGERAAEAEVGSEVGRAVSIVDGDDGLAGKRRGVEVAVAGAIDAGSAEVGGEGGPVVELGVSVEVFADGDVEGRARLVDEK